MQRQNIFAGIRVFPITNPSQVNTNSCVSLANNCCEQILITSKQSYKKFKLDCCLSELCSQEDVYQNFCLSQVQAFINGYNCNFIICANSLQVSSEGYDSILNGNSKNTQEQKGIIPRMIDQISHTVNYFKERQFLFKVSYIEINQEQIIDLLSLKRIPLQIKYNKNSKQTFINNLQLKNIEKLDQIQSYYLVGNRKKSYAYSKKYRQAKNSTSIFTIYLESTQETGTIMRHSKYTFTQLPPTVFEQSSQSSNPTQIMTLQRNKMIHSFNSNNLNRRAGHSNQINLSKVAFQNVIKAICYSQQNASTIPYCDSKVTKILRQAIGGNSKTSILSLLDPSQGYVNTTFKILKTLNLATQIENYPFNIKEYQIFKSENSLITILQKIKKDQNLLEKMKLELQVIQNTNQEEYIKVESQRKINQNEINQFMSEQEIAVLIQWEKSKKQEQLKQDIKQLSRIVRNHKKQIINYKQKNRNQSQFQQKSSFIHQHEQQNLSINKRKQILVAIKQLKEKKLHQAQYEVDTIEQSRQIKRQVYAVEIQFQKQRCNYLEKIRQLESDLSLYKKIAEHSLQKQEIQIIKSNSKYDQTKRDYEIPSFLVRDKKLTNANFKSPFKSQRKFMISPRSKSFNSLYTSQASRNSSKDKLRKLNIASRSFKNFKQFKQQISDKQSNNDYQNSIRVVKPIAHRTKFNGFSKSKEKINQLASPSNKNNKFAEAKKKLQREHIRHVRSQYDIDMTKRKQRKQQQKSKQKVRYSPYRGVRNVKDSRSPFRF